MGMRVEIGRQSFVVEYANWGSLFGGHLGRCRETPPRWDKQRVAVRGSESPRNPVVDLDQEHGKKLFQAVRGVVSIA